MSTATDRLVEASRIKRALEAVYNGVLAKGAAPFVYLRYAAPALREPPNGPPNE